MLPHRRPLIALTLARNGEGRTIADETNVVAINDFINGGSCFSSPTSLQRMQDRVILLCTLRQLSTVLALVELDGIARRILLCTPDLTPHLATIIAEAKVDYVVTDGSLPLGRCSVPRILLHSKIVAHGPNLPRDAETEWILFTSGTTGRPKMVAHTLSSLTGPLDDGVAVASGAIWSTFYDIRRYGGLQILLRALIGGGSMVLSSATEDVGDFLARLAFSKVSHISGTPSHWRRVLMNPLAGAISPAYVRLSGEIADQAILDRLHARYPSANIAHAFASTEAGVAFDVRDGLAGFPVSFLTEPNHLNVEMRIIQDTLRIRSSRIASGYLGQQLRNCEGFVDTGDMVEQRGHRYYFMGRREGVINVGGLKVYPEEVEAVICHHPDVRIARVWARRSPITGAIVAADVVLKSDIAADNWHTIRTDLLRMCVHNLARYKVPVTWRRMEKIDITASGKVQRA